MKVKGYWLKGSPERGKKIDGTAEDAEDAENAERGEEKKRNTGFSVPSALSAVHTSLS